MKDIIKILKKVICPLLNAEIEDNQCWHCFKYKKCFPNK